MRDERTTMESLSALGRELRAAQTQLDAVALRQLSVRRQTLIADLLERARRRAAEAGVRPSVEVLSQVSTTLLAALVDLAAAATVLAGRLVRPMSHSGFGPRPHVDLALEPSASCASEAEIPDADADEWRFWPTELEDVDGDLTTPPRLRSVPMDDVRDGADDVAAAESIEERRSRELIKAEAAVRAGQERLRWIENQRMAAQSEQADADRSLSEAKVTLQAANNQRPPRTE